MEIAQRVDESSWILHTMPPAWMRFNFIFQRRRLEELSYEKSAITCFGVVIRALLPAFPKIERPYPQDFCLKKARTAKAGIGASIGHC
jgi:hypothetical protein